MSSDGSLEEHVHDYVEIKDGGRRLVGPHGTELVNQQHMGCDTRIGRSSKWGNPFRLEKDGGSYSREESVELYRGWFLGHVEEGTWDPEELRGQTLGCYCLDKLCHGVVILNYLADVEHVQATLTGENNVE